MDRKIIGITIIGFSTILLAGIIYVVFFSNFSFGDLFKKEETVVEEPVTEEQTTEPKTENNVVRPVINIHSKEVQEKKEQARIEASEFGKDDLMRIARSFAERYGSYSNHSNFDNIVDLKIFMSSRMQLWADNYVAEQRKNEVGGDIYYGITTKAASEEVKEYDEDVGRATVVVKTRRRELVGSTSNISDSFDQNIVIKFVKERNAWKIDNATWENK